MFNIVFSEEYETTSQALVRMRERAGLSQRDMAAALERSQGHVHRMETRQRSIELVEFCRMARACGVDPVAALQGLIDAWDAVGCGYQTLARQAVKRAVA